jgi:ATP/maltotriose-dependent transcriptional regulator MalT
MGAADILNAPSCMITDSKVRQWLSLLRRPDRLAATDLAGLLAGQGLVGAHDPPRVIGAAATDVLLRAIDRLRSPNGAGRDEQLPHLVLTTCFVDGTKLFQAANKLGMSERQLSRERAWAISLLRRELEGELQPRAESRVSYQPEPIPAIGDYLPRSALITELQTLLGKERLVVVSGAAGIGKTSLVAELATEAAAAAAVMWYRFRTGLNDSAAAMLLEVADVLASEGDEALLNLVFAGGSAMDVPRATRLALRGLAGRDRLLVFDDFHLVEDDELCAGLIEELVVRLPRLRVVLLSRRQDGGRLVGATYAVRTFSRRETETLLTKLGADAPSATVDALHAWTNGVPHLINLAAAWLKTTEAEQVDAGMAALTSRAQVQAFLLGTITDLLDADDRAILEAASIFRGRFTDDGLAVVAARSRGTVLDASHRLVRAHAATRSRDGSCAFFHTTVREYVYDRLSAEQRAELHPRAAAWFQQAGQLDEAGYHRRQAAAAKTAMRRTRTTSLR